MAVAKRALDVFFGGDEAQDGELDVVGNLADFVGVGGKIRFNLANLGRKDKAVLITVITKDGKKGKIYGSVNVSAAIRAKSLTTEELLGLRVALGETGEDKIPVLKLIGWEGSSSDIVVTKNMKAVEGGGAVNVTIESFEELAW